MALMPDLGTTILKRDATGRISYLPERREALLDEFERSGLKGAAFARAVGISYPTFANWIQSRRHARGDYLAASGTFRAPCAGGVVTAAEHGPRWLEAVGPSACSCPGPVAPSAPLAVVLPCGTRLLVEDARQATLAAQLLQARQTLATGAPC